MKLTLALLWMFLSAVPETTASWIENAFAKGKKPPFSFVYNGKSSSDFILKWKHSIVRQDAADGTSRYVVTYLDPATKMKVECDVTGYADSDAVDWVLHFTNTSSKDSPVIKDVKALDYKAVSSCPGMFETLRLQGSLAWKEDFKPILDTLRAGEDIRYAPRGGRSSDWDVCPFFNTRFPDGKGIVTAVGWTGSWYARMSSNGRTLDISAGMQELELYLHPGESIRTPLVSMLFWEGDCFEDGCNRWRRFMLAHNMRKTNGQTTGVPLLANISASDPYPCNERTCLTEEVAVTYIHRFEFFGIHPDVFWLDAGWYTGDVINDRRLNWENTAGTWRPNPARFPNGLKPVADAAHAQGSKLMVWFEPERACDGSQVAREHPEWLLHAKDNSNYLFNFGNPDALEWMCSYIGDFIEESGIDWYRQDNCFHSLRPYWDENDEPGRKGITEIRHIEGLYAFLDYLLERFPDMLIDNCASGGRRLDIEMYRRSIPLWRTDCGDKGYDKAEGRQGHTYGLNFFLPVHGISLKETDAYPFFSALTACSVFGIPIVGNRNVTLDLLHDRVDLYKEIQPYFYEDYYPLTGIANCTTPKKWLSYQLHRPSDNTGVVLAFRHQNSPVDSITVSLKGLDPSVSYYVLDQEKQEMTVHSGSELSSSFTIHVADKAGAVMLRYGPDFSSSVPDSN